MNQNSLKILQPMKYYYLYFIISLTVIIPGSLALGFYGLKPSIDFTGGSTIVWSTQADISDETIAALLKENGQDLREIHRAASTLTLTTSPLTQSTYQALLTDARISSASVKELSFDTVGPSLGSELIRKTLAGIGLAALVIMIYVARRFKDLRYGVSAILAMLHDSLVLIGSFALLGHFMGVEVDTLFVTALLTILSFSVHDTIVVYDRIRELKKHYAYLEFDDIINRAVVETMGRSINNSLTIIFMLISMYLMGGETIKLFILALLIGTISGTYSSTFTAAPILILWDKLARKHKS